MFNVNLKVTFSSIISGFIFSVTIASAGEECDRILVHLQMTDAGFVMVDAVVINDRLLVCSSEHLSLQEHVNNMQQQSGWFGAEWTEDDTANRLVDQSVTRWTQGLDRFIGPKSDTTKATRPLS